MTHLIMVKFLFIGRVYMLYIEHCYVMFLRSKWNGHCYKLELDAH